MADWNVGQDDALAAQIWAKELILEANDMILWGRFMGEGANNFVQVRNELTREKGYQVTFGLVRKLTGAGVTGDSTLEGSEEVPTTYSDTVVLDQVRNAVRLNGRLAEQRAAYDMRESAKELLKMWMAERIDADLTTDATTSPTRVLYQGTATSTATLAAGDLFDLNLINKAKVLSRTLTPKILPVQKGGRKLHLAVFHPDCEYDLEVESSSWSAAQKQAKESGETNPLFTDALGMWRNTILTSFENIPTVSNWGSGSNLNGAENIFVGRQALLLAWGKQPFWVEKEFDFGNKTGFAVGAIYGRTKAVFNSEDHAIIGLRSIRTNVVEQ